MSLLDIRWNCVGLVGSKALLNSLKRNHTLQQLLIVGNNIPEDIVQSISRYIYIYSPVVCLVGKGEKKGVNIA